MSSPKKVAFINSKGGCGKTTSLFNVAGVLSEKGEKVLIIDLDKQKNTTEVFLTENESYQNDLDAGIEHKTILDYLRNEVNIEECVKRAYIRKRSNSKPRPIAIDVVIGDNKLKDERLLQNMSISIKDDLNEFIKRRRYSWVLVDMPPSSKAINELCFSQIVDHVIVPFSSDLFSVMGYDDLINEINQFKIEYNSNLHILGIYLARYMENCSVDKYIKETLQEMLDDNMFIDVQIPLRADIREALMFGKPISYYKLFSASKDAYERLVRQMEYRIDDWEKGKRS